MNPLLLKVPERLTTPRLVLRAIQPADAAMLNRAIHESFSELKPWMPWARSVPALASTVDYCKQAAVDFEACREFHMLIFCRADQEFIGCTGLVRGDWLIPKFEIGYWVRTPHAGQGYITEAVKAMTRFAKLHLRLRRLELRTDARNRRSAAVARRSGFKLEGRLRQDGRDNRDRLRDTLVFARIF